MLKSKIFMKSPKTWTGRRKPRTVCIHELFVSFVSSGKTPSQKIVKTDSEASERTPLTPPTFSHSRVLFQQETSYSKTSKSNSCWGLLLSCKASQKR